MELTQLTALSPVDGRYAHKVDCLRPYLSEYGLIRHRILIEIRWLQALADAPQITEITALSAAANQLLTDIFEKFGEQDAQAIKAIEKTINHDVKAIEYFLKQKFQANPELNKISEFIHFACTSDDINNLAYGIMLKSAKQECLIPVQTNLIDKLKLLAHQHAAQPMLARTHGQPATPTTLGKEFANFAARLQRPWELLLQLKFAGKFNGAVGNFNAHYFAYPEINWEVMAKQLVEQFGLQYNAYTTQIEPHDSIAEFCDHLKRFNTILIDLNSDIWGYIALGYFKLKPKVDEVGSSTMPHKINPIDFENSEGNLSIANAMLVQLAAQLPCSRWQRDLRDSTLLRNLGVAFAHSLIAYQSLLTGLEKLEVDTDALNTDLNQHWEVLAEAIQTLLRRYNYQTPYEELKTLTRGKIINQEILNEFIKKLSIPEQVKTRLLTLRPEHYLGNAIQKAKDI